MLVIFKVGQNDSESNVAMVKALDKELSHADFASVCQKMQRQQRWSDTRPQR